MIGSIQECCDLGAGTGGVGAEPVLAGAGGDALLHGPQDRVVVVCVGAHIGKRVGPVSLGGAVGTPQEGDDLGAGAAHVGTECVGGSTGGTDIIAMLVTKYHNVSPGRVLMVCDFCVIAMTLLIYDHVDREAFGGLIYGYVMMGIVSFTVDYVLTGKTQSAQLFIFTDKYDEVARELTNQVHRGVTLIDAKGWYTGQDKKIILIVARKHEASDVLRIAKQIDPDVFMTMAPVMGVFGKGFEEVKGVK